MESILLQLVSFQIAGYPIILSTVCLLLIYIYFKITFTYWQSMGVPQLNPSFPFGDITSVVLRRQNLACKLQQIYEQAKIQSHKFVGLYLFNRKALLIVDPLFIKDIIKTNFAHFSDRGLHSDEKNDPLNAHLVCLKEPKWKKLRTKLTHAYSPKQLKSMVGTLSDCGLNLREFVQEYADSGNPIELREILARYSTDVIGSCAYGLECNTLRNPYAELGLMAKRALTFEISDYFRVFTIHRLPKLAQFIGLGYFRNQITSFFRNFITQTIEHREENNIRRDDFLQILIQLKNKKNPDGSAKPDSLVLTMEEAAAEALIFLLAGQETTALTISYAIFEMAMNHEIQEKARAEVRRVLTEHKEVCSYEAIGEMTYLDMIVRETLRKYPPLPGVLRRCTKSYRIPDSKVTIEEDVIIFISSFALHRDPEYFPNPNLFDPERFSEENRLNIPDYTYLPFGDGPRMCIAMRFSMIEMKITLSHLINNFIFHIDSKTQLPIEIVKSGVFLNPEGGLWMNVQSAITEKSD